MFGGMLEGPDEDVLGASVRPRGRLQSRHLLVTPHLNRVDVPVFYICSLNFKMVSMATDRVLILFQTLTK